MELDKNRDLEHAVILLRQVVEVAFRDQRHKQPTATLRHVLVNDYFNQCHSNYDENDCMKNCCIAHTLFSS